MALPVRRRGNKIASIKYVPILVLIFGVASVPTILNAMQSTSGGIETDEIALAITKTIPKATETTTSVTETGKDATAIIATDDNADIKKNRSAILDKCKDSIKPDPDQVRKEMFSAFPETGTEVPKQTPKPSIKKCKNVVLDFGANVGDTAGHLIDSGLPNCPKAEADSHLRLMLGDRRLEVGKWNMVTRFLKQMMDANKLFPEDYCYYGIEGNPVFTERLQGIEDFINSIEPKPLVHASFLTESVGAGEYGMTKLYLDTVNEKENFWGSSIMQGHQDVRKSMDEGKLEEAPHHDVMGYTITKLMEMTLLGLKEDATEEEKKGAHLLLKVDIEGGEYVLTEEVVKSKALCKFVEMGNTVDVVIETHSQRVTGPNPLAFKFGGWKKELTDCGVTFRGLQAWWA